MQRVWSTYLDQSRQGRSRSSSPQVMDTSLHSRPASVAASAYSQATSTRHMLSTSLDPPSAPFSSSAPPSHRSPPSSIADDAGSVSLTVNYLPTKFSSSLLTGVRSRRGAKGPGPGPALPKRGGGVDAFRSGEARMPGPADEDYDGVTGAWFGARAGKKKMRWNRFKWMLFFANLLLTAYSLVALIFCLLTWFNVWTNADVVRVGDRTELVVSTIAASFGVLTFIIGWAGILLNNRSFLAAYTFLLWVTFAWLVVPGYVAYRRRTYNLEGKVNAQWSRALGAAGRARVQAQLACCGYFSPFVEATVTQTCYARSVLPGCKGPYLDFQRMVLGRWFAVAFAVVPVHIAVMVVGLLCSNHVTYRFGKGMMPKAYRLSPKSMAVIMDNYANQLAEQYGAEMASEILAKSRSTQQLDGMAPMPYTPSPASSAYGGGGAAPFRGDAPQPRYHGKYDSVGGRAPEGAF